MALVRPVIEDEEEESDYTLRNEINPRAGRKGGVKVSLAALHTEGGGKGGRKRERGEEEICYRMLRG